MKLTFLGTGTSVGVPVIGCQCDVCNSKDQRNQRLRCSAMIETDNTRIIIDCGPDFRQQMLKQPFRKIDAVLITHIHYDHVGGIDDLRPFCQFGSIDVFANENTVNALHKTVPYVFAEHRYPGVPNIELHTIKPHQLLSIGDINVMPIQVMHDKLPILGFRSGSLLYITDMKTIEEKEYQYFTGVKVLVVNALRYSPNHHSHQTVDEALAFAQRIGAERTFFIHMCHDIGLHEEVNKRLILESKNLNTFAQLAYDGLTIEV